jgi:hypothetical protein
MRLPAVIRKNGVRYTAPDFLQPAVVLPNTCIIPDNRMFYHSFEESKNKEEKSALSCILL